MHYRDLEIYRISFELFFKVHDFTKKLPKHEFYELGSQVRRSADSVNSNIVEGYGRSRYKKDYVKFLVYSLSSNDETINHLKKLERLYYNYEDECKSLIVSYELLGGKINKFIAYVIKNWNPKPLF